MREREVAVSTASTASWAAATELPTTCTEKHIVCRKHTQGKSFLPSRLVDTGTLGTDSTLWLILTS
jgi:hypothetical protein